MFTCVLRVKVVLLFLWAILRTSNSVPYPGYIGAITWNWDDSGSGNEEPEDPAPPPQHGTGTSHFLLLTESALGISYESRLPPSERVSLSLVSIGPKYRWTLIPFEFYRSVPACFNRT